MTWYGQTLEDKLIHNLLAFKAGGELSSYGVGIDVGAADGTRGSNSLHFEELGWDILCVEPNPKYDLSHRKHVAQVACGLGEPEQEMTVFITESGDRKAMSALSSLVPDQRLVDDHVDWIKSSYTISVPVMSLDMILANWKHTADARRDMIDFISIDTEGTELDVLTSFDLETWEVPLLVIENNYEDKNITDYLTTKGYTKLTRLRVNDFYILNSKDLQD